MSIIAKEYLKFSLRFLVRRFCKADVKEKRRSVGTRAALTDIIEPVC